MTTRTFRAPNMLQALQTVQKELGPQAIVISMRNIPGGPAWQVWRKPSCEVVASLPVEGEAAPVKEKQPAVEVAPKPAALKPAIIASAWVAQDIQRKPEEKPVIETDDSPVRPVQTQNRAAEPVVEFEDKSLLGKAYRHLLNQGVAEDVVKRITRVCLQTLAPETLKDVLKLRRMLQQQLEAGLHQTNTAKHQPSRVICLLGGYGSGKTSAAARLISYYKLNEHKSVVWAAADTVRTGGIAEARVFAESLGVPLKLVYTPEDLAEIATSGEGDVVIVDFPGCNPRKETDVVEIGAMLAQVPDRTIYLVAPATTKESDLNQLYASFSPFRLDGMICTRMDETVTYGNLYNFAYRTQLPMVWFSAGRRVLEDFYNGDITLLVNSLFNERPWL